ncbi:hypothetical protein [Mesorhizobium sp. M7A.F.Ca.MR.362.00.0.0]|uniref:hypothetical protein n=1 Tax=Mesorhizobium sp. M7A.F.Ca.MR.362.00.0.0 TaxID=2496779 RepID=UPI000FD1D2BB|nr:hypothetical protein [Mesorhizobium sp. M7A.F.Ca.MR.362.00.0.0]RUU75712.1 hypothetical protein EOC06_29535 [Mesorhizobium sp. M7A.F.Ca.MR.362.00.0.0]RWN95461.1 MAG: hypothetical protein EOS05_11750 [Mesorhizobium sp.]
MIVEYEANGRIIHIISDPVHAGVRNMMLNEYTGPNTVLDLPPLPKPLVQEKDWDTGEPRFNLDGTPKMISPGVDNQRCDISADYILDGVVTTRPVFDLPDEIELIADGVDIKTIPLPDPCDVRLDGEPMTLTGGSLDLTSDMPAEYTLELVQWPYLPKTIKVFAHASE